ncbi:hypothetical protein R4Z10_19305 [Niallia sp. XMNu-256]|uniref:YczE/YyaS/YitT family protein n=1 Tax=Niallia sp. XMNu-256 TaxID=3082444 RepID=UPI0030CABD96
MTKRVILFLVGLLAISLGSVHMIKVSKLGVQPFDVLYIGLHQKTSISIGFASISTGIVLLTIAFILHRQKLKIGTILDVICLGLLIDLFLYLDFIITPATLIWQIFFLIFGTVLISLGAALTIFSNLGAGPIDTFMLVVHKRFGLSVRVATTLIEGGALLAGFLLGGPIGIGTVAVCLLMGPMIEFFLVVLQKSKSALYHYKPIHPKLRETEYLKETL